MNIYSKMLETRVIKEMLTEEQKDRIKALEIEEYKRNMTFKEFYIQLVEKAKETYTKSEFIQLYDATYNMSHLSVCEVFEPLDMLEWELSNGEDLPYFKWNQRIDTMLSDELIEDITNDFNRYFKEVESRVV